MSELDTWIAEQTRREQRIVRLEDALLADRYGPYFFYRLRFFMARTAVAAVLHGIRILLLLGAFAVSEFLFYILLTAAAALIADTWWGALESMRSRIRHLQRIGARFRAPNEIARWVRLSLVISGIGLVASVTLLGLGLAIEGGLTPILVMAVAVMVGASLNIVTRTYHSGAYAVRRVYRPLPSLLAADIVSLVALLLLWPIAGIWAFAIAEMLTVAILVSVSLVYTTRTYRSLAFPTLPSLLKESAPLPDRRALRSALAPAISYGLVGLEALVLLAALLAGGSESTAILVALLAALSPVIRAGFEWARLLYFDLARLEVSLLAGLRRRFDLATAVLSVVVGSGTWLIAALVAVIILGVRDATLIVALLPFLVVRSVLAAAQMRAFTGRTYLRLALSGLVATAGFGISLLLLEDASGRLVGFTLAMALAALMLVRSPELVASGDRVVGVTTWLERLRRVAGPVDVYGVTFDRRDQARGLAPDERRTLAWRRHRLAHRLARDVGRMGGTTTWTGGHHLAWFVPRDGRDRAVSFNTHRFGGLVTAMPTSVRRPDGTTAAISAAGIDPDEPRLGPDRLLRDFAERFPSGIAYDFRARAPEALGELTSHERATILRAAMRFARGAEPARDRTPYEVTATVTEGLLEQVYLVSRDTPVAARRAWRAIVSDANHRAAALGGPSPPKHTRSTLPLADET